MINKIFGSFVGGRAGLGLLIIRIVFGLGILHHGWGKIQHPFTWMGPDAPVPGILQALAALSEFGGGIALSSPAEAAGRTNWRPCTWRSLCLC